MRVLVVVPGKLGILEEKKGIAYELLSEIHQRKSSRGNQLFFFMVFCKSSL